MINGLDLFSGIGGITLALAPWVRPVAYCENEPYAQAVLLSRQASGELPIAPIWDDVTTLQAADIGEGVDIIYGGFPCQDISVAGLGAGLDGKRSGLVFEVFRLVAEAKPSFVFLENVPAIRTRGAERVVKELAALGYDCRWDHLSAFDMGAPHKRERWWLLAYGNGNGRQGLAECNSQGKIGSGAFWNDAYGFRDVVSDAKRKSIRIKQGRRSGPRRPGLAGPRGHGAAQFMADACGIRQQAGEIGGPTTAGKPQSDWGRWWGIEPAVDRVAHGIPKRVDRLRALGNAVVPAQAREAFCRLIGF